METLFVTRDATLRQKENTLAVTLEGNTRFLPIEAVGHLVLLGETRLNTRLLTLCGKHGVRISVFDYYGYCKGCFEPIDRNPAGLVKLQQAQVLLNEGKRLALAREIVRGAAHNKLANLRYYHFRGQGELEPVISHLHALTLKIATAESTAALMGIEGNISAGYYAAWKQIDPALDFAPRVRRPPNNPLNCLISFLNQLVYTVCRHELSKTHLEETFGLLHSPGQGRASLSLDLAEPFKPVLADQLIFRLVRRHMLAESWFDQQEGVCLLTEVGRRHVSEQFALRLEEKHAGRSYREWIYREAMALERHVLDVAEYESFKRRP